MSQFLHRSPLHAKDVVIRAGAWATVVMESTDSVLGSVIDFHTLTFDINEESLTNALQTKVNPGISL